MFAPFEQKKNQCHLFEINLKAIDGINMLRSACADKTLVNIDIMWAPQIPKESHLVETVNPCYYDLH